MTSIPIDAFVFTIGLLCHGLILYENPHLLINSRIITTKNTKLDCPVFFSSINNAIEKIHKTFYTDLTKPTQEIIAELQPNLTIFPLFYEKLLQLNPNSTTETIHNLINKITKENKYEDGIYLFSIHKKTDTGLENIPFGNGNPLNLMLVDSWKILDTVFEKNIESDLESFSSKSLESIFKDIETSYHIKKSHAEHNKIHKEIVETLDAGFFDEKRKAATEYKLYIDRDRIISIKLSVLLGLLSQYNPLHSKHNAFFNIYDFTCNGFSSLVSEKDAKNIHDKFESLDIEMQISYGGKFATKNKKKTKRYV